MAREKLSGSHVVLEEEEDSSSMGSESPSSVSKMQPTRKMSESDSALDVEARSSSGLAAEHAHKSKRVSITEPNSPATSVRRESHGPMFSPGTNPRSTLGRQNSVNRAPSGWSVVADSGEVVAVIGTLQQHVEHPEWDPPKKERFSFSVLLRLHDIDHLGGYHPTAVVRAMILLSWNAMLMAVAEIVLEVLMFSGAMPKVEFRTGFLFLTLLSMLLAMHTLSDVLHDELDTTVQMTRIALLVEVGLIVADSIFIAYPGPDEQWLRAAIRGPFIVLTALNVVFLMFAILRLRILGDVFAVPWWRAKICGPRADEEDPDMVVFPEPGADEDPKAAAAGGRRGSKADQLNGSVGGRRGSKADQLNGARRGSKSFEQPRQSYFAEEGKIVLTRVASMV